jgi:hypothetical protein
VVGAYRTNGASGAEIPVQISAMSRTLRVRSARSEWPESAHPARCRSLRRGSLNRTYNGHSGPTAGTGLHAPKETLPAQSGDGAGGWLPALGTRGFHRPLSDPRADLRQRFHGSSATAGTCHIRTFTAKGCEGQERNWLRIELVEQRFCFFEIGRVETLRKPAVDGCKKVASLTIPSLVVQ